MASWSKLITTFDESCALFNERLLSGVTPHAEPLAAEKLSLLSTRELAPRKFETEPNQAFHSADASIVHLNERQHVAPLHEARSAQWQRWARAWNEIVFSLRSRDHLSDTERDDLLFFSLSRPAHVHFFRAAEYLVLPAMLTSPIFYPRLWHRGLGHLYPHTLRTMLQARDLGSWVLVHLGITTHEKKDVLLQVLTTLMEHSASIVRLRSVALVVMLKDFRLQCVDAIKLLMQWRRALLALDADGTAGGGAGAPATGGGGSGATTPRDSREKSSASLFEGDGAPRDIGTVEHLAQSYGEAFDQKLTAALDSFKSILADSTGELEVARASKGHAQVLRAYKHLRSLISIHSVGRAEAMAAVLRSDACFEVLQALHRMLTTDSHGGEPQTAEARRQLLFFCNSLRNRWMPQPSTVRHMRTITSFTPHYAEDVTYSKAQLKDLEHRDDGVNLEHLLQSLFAQEWANLSERVKPETESEMPIHELARWASDRAQVLSRTVRGVMLYADALRIQARLEGMHESEIEAVVGSKFEYVITCQIYAKLRDSKQSDDRWKAKCIDELRHQYAANLKIAYVETVANPDKTSVNYSVLLGVDPRNPCKEGEELLYKVKLPGNPIVGEGKPENQNHAVIFTRGEHLQTLDMNQDNYLGEAYKLRNLLECFTGTVRIVGCREHIFSEAGGAVAAFAASNEFVFGTSLQRFLTYPLCVRFHYGHPDTWDKQWAITNGGVSKASRTLHLSEDIFGGFNVVARGGSIVYQEFIHVGKGRDVTFIATNGFEQKISAGNAFQSISRDAKRLSSGFDLARLLSFFCSGQGEHPIVS